MWAYASAVSQEASQWAADHQCRQRRQAQGRRPRAGYVVLTAGEGALQVEFVRVLYDVERVAQAIEVAAGMPDAFAWVLRSLASAK